MDFISYFDTLVVVLYYFVNFVTQIGHWGLFQLAPISTPLSLWGFVYKGFFLVFCLFLSTSSLITVGFFSFFLPFFLLALSYFLALQDAPGSSYICPAPALEPAISPRSAAPSTGEWYENPRSEY